MSRHRLVAGAPLVSVPYTGVALDSVDIQPRVYGDSQPSELIENRAELVAPLILRPL